MSKSTISTTDSSDKQVPLTLQNDPLSARSDQVELCPACRIGILTSKLGCEHCLRILSEQEAVRIHRDLAASATERYLNGGFLILTTRGNHIVVCRGHTRTFCDERILVTLENSTSFNIATDRWHTCAKCADVLGVLVSQIQAAS